MNIPEISEIERIQSTYTFELGNKQIIKGLYRNTWNYSNPFNMPYTYGVYKLRFFKRLPVFIWKHSMKKFPLFYFIGHLSTYQKITRLPTRIIDRIEQR